jgi:HAD superfamily hydrolase (TIGR01509 family)
MFSATLFDLDGTLIDSEREHAASIARVLLRLGIPLTPEEEAFVIGHAWQDIYELLKGRYPASLTLSLEELKRASVEDKRVQLTQGLPALPGAVELVRRLAVRGAPMTIVSGSSRAEIADALHWLGLTDCFPFYFGAEDYPRGKPAPDGYLLAAEALDTPPHRCLVFEDSAAGIASARAARTFCIAVRAGNFSGQDQSQAHQVVDSLVEVSDERLASWFHQRTRGDEPVGLPVGE